MKIIGVGRLSKYIIVTVHAGRVKVVSALEFLERVSSSHFSYLAGNNTVG